MLEFERSSSRPPPLGRWCWVLAPSMASSGLVADEGDVVWEDRHDYGDGEDSREVEESAGAAWEGAVREGDVAAWMIRGEGAALPSRSITAVAPCAC